MSLKAFHVVFITACLGLGLGLVAWGASDWRSGTGADATGLWLAVLGALLVVAAIPYGYWFLRKLRNISYL